MAEKLYTREDEIAESHICEPIADYFNKIDSIKLLIELKSILAEYNVFATNGIHFDWIIVKTDERNLLDDYIKYVKSYFEGKITLKYSEELTKSTYPKVSSMFICNDSKTQLGSIHDDLMIMLSILRDDPKVFHQFIKLIIKKKDIKGYKLLADDIVCFFLADFTSAESYAVNCLSLFKPFLNVFCLR